MKAIMNLFILLVWLTGCQSQSPSNTLKVAATSVPHAELLELIKPDLKEEGIELEIVVVEDYATPNRALADGEVDANFFQHYPFLEMQIKEFGYPLESLGGVHIEPMGLYSHKIHALADLKKGAHVAIPNDPTNEARALNLLEQEELILLKRHDAHTSVLDILSNPKGLKLVEVDSPLLTRTLEDVDMAAITTNFALQGGLSPKNDSLAIEASDSPFANIVVIRKGEGSRKDLQALMKALRSDKVKKYILDRYKGAIMPAF